MSRVANGTANQEASRATSRATNQTMARDLLAVVRLDGMLLRPYLRQLALIIAAVGLLALFSGVPSVIVVAASMYAVLMMAYPFAVGDKNDIETLHGVLPVGRRVLVVGRYVLLAAVFVVLVLGAVLLAVVAARIRGLPVGSAELLSVVALGTALFAVLGGSQLPVYYALGYTRGRFIAYLPLVVVSGAIAAFGTLAGDLELDRWLIGLSGAGWPMLASAWVVYGCSAAVSVRLDERRAFRPGR